MTEFSIDGATVGVYGRLDSKAEGVPVTLALTDVVGARRLVSMGHSDADGQVFVRAEVDRGWSWL